MCILASFQYNMVNLAIFQDVNFIYDVRIYAIIEVARSRISLTPVSPLMEWPGTPLYSDTEGIFGKENSAVIHLLSMVARFEDICSSFCACSPSRTSLHLLAIPLRRTFFLFSEPTLYLSLGRYWCPLRRGLLARGQFY